MDFIVYVHIFPNGKLYFGITSQKPLHRWYSDGSGYKKSPLIYNAIKKYGWDNVKHSIVFDSLSKEDAIEMEQYLILMFDTINSDIGYNLTFGGEGRFGHTVSKETRDKMSASHIGKSPLCKRVSGGGRIFTSVHECSRELKIPQSTLSRYLRCERPIPKELVHLDLKFI